MGIKIFRKPGHTPIHTRYVQLTARIAPELNYLRRLLTAEGRGECLKIYESYELSPAQDDRTYGALARRHGLTEHQVKNHLDSARVRLEQIVRERLARGVSSPRELADEMNDLFSG